ncbi:hypothetical protein DM02DRAFT_664055 [Periconia macrospinosa]|uniref:Uncharacterized protein n=1 Tax=Periconia macrospinosa TaxID=97972 RepID=A0A2V1D012_9PLEO|nr:hypothetical protein DM02DRAFT_664055 [Periconia macrospinosa]
MDPELHKERGDSPAESGLDAGRSASGRRNATRASQNRGGFICQGYANKVSRPHLAFLRAKGRPSAEVPEPSSHQVMDGNRSRSVVAEEHGRQLPKETLIGSSRHALPVHQSNSRRRDHRFSKHDYDRSHRHQEVVLNTLQHLITNAYNQTGNTNYPQTTRSLHRDNTIPESPPTLKIRQTRQPPYGYVGREGIHIDSPFMCEYGYNLSVSATVHIVDNAYIG